MDPTIATGTPATTGPVHFLNIEYIFYLLYQALFGPHGGTFLPGLSWVVPLITTTWIVITIFAYLLALGFLVLFVWSTLRMHQVEDQESLRFQTLGDAHQAEEVTEHHRWEHVRELIDSPNESDWRQAIIEADIILDDLLTRLGFQGDTVGEKLRAVDPAKFHTLQEAWDAHRVRNDIAHQGSAYPLNDHLAYRTVMHYENVFKEHGEI